jgi:hypothetical protein
MPEKERETTNASLRSEKMAGHDVPRLQANPLCPAGWNNTTPKPIYCIHSDRPKTPASAAWQLFR